MTITDERLEEISRIGPWRERSYAVNGIISVETGPSHSDEVRSMARELLAARKRLTKLEAAIAERHEQPCDASAWPCWACRALTAYDATVKD